MPDPVYERPTDELRQVRVEGDPFMGQPAIRHYRVQRKWLVQSGPRYRADRPREPSDDCTAGWHPIEPNLGFEYTPVRAVWRDLPIVSEAETSA